MFTLFCAISCFKTNVFYGFAHIVHRMHERARKAQSIGFPGTGAGNKFVEMVAQRMGPWLTAAVAMMQ